MLLMQEKNLGISKEKKNGNIFLKILFGLSVLICVCQVTAKSDFTDESYSSSWHYINHIEKHSKTTGTDYGHDDYVFHDELLQSQVLYSKTYSLYNIDFHITLGSCNIGFLPYLHDFILVINPGPQGSICLTLLFAYV